MTCLVEHTVSKVIVPRLKWSGRGIAKNLADKVQSIVAIGTSKDGAVEISLIRVT
jgi:hypothetical protein